jgi:hypothetical protein
MVVPAVTLGPGLGDRLAFVIVVEPQCSTARIALILRQVKIWQGVTTRKSNPLTLHWRLNSAKSVARQRRVHPYIPVLEPLPDPELPSGQTTGRAIRPVGTRIEGRSNERRMGYCSISG